MRDQSCKELVELVTEYLEGALSAEERASFEHHLTLCDGCTAHIAQVRAVIGSAGTIESEELSPATEDRLAELFRSWAEE